MNEQQYINLSSLESSLPKNIAQIDNIHSTLQPNFENIEVTDKKLNSFQEETVSTADNSMPVQSDLSLSNELIPCNLAEENLLVATLSQNKVIIMPNSEESAYIDGNDIATQVIIQDNGTILEGGDNQEQCSLSSHIEALSDKTNDLNASSKGEKMDNHLNEGDSSKTCPINDDLTRKNLRQIKRKDLENIIIEQFHTQVFYEHELGYQKDLCKRLETTLEAANKRALKLVSEIEDLKRTTSTLENEFNLRKERLFLPIKTKRSVGIQYPSSSNIYSQIQSKKHPLNSSQERISKKRKLNEAGVNCGSRKYKKSSFSKSVESFTNKESTDYSTNSYANGCQELSRRLSNDLPVSSTNSILRKTSHNGNHFRKSSKKLQVKFQENEKSRPSQEPFIEMDDENERPRQPVLKVKRKHKSITLSWNMKEAYDPNIIAAFQLFACETDSLHSKDRTWHYIGEVRALELPMMCTLADFKSHCYYHFSVRGIGCTGRRGPFSKPCTVFMP